MKFEGKFQFRDSVQFVEAQQAFVFEKNTVFPFTGIIYGASEGLLTRIHSNKAAQFPLNEIGKWAKLSEF